MPFTVSGRLRPFSPFLAHPPFSPASEDAGGEAGRHRRAQLLALLDEGGLPGPAADQRLLHRLASAGRSGSSRRRGACRCRRCRRGYRARRAGLACARAGDCRSGRRSPSARRSCSRGSRWCRGSPPARPARRRGRPAAGATTRTSMPVSLRAPRSTASRRASVFSDGACATISSRFHELVLTADQEDS